ncbi:MAG TPA: hypothetical protein VF020_21045, partial [Chthoniobacterales bacterium]
GAPIYQRSKKSSRSNLDDHRPGDDNSGHLGCVRKRRKKDNRTSCVDDGIVAFSQTDFTEDLKKILVPVV